MMSTIFFVVVPLAHPYECKSFIKNAAKNGARDFVTTSMQEKKIALEYPRECKSSISKTSTKFTGGFFPVSAQGKHVALAHLRQCDISISKTEKNGIGDRLHPVTKKLLDQFKN